MVGAACDTPPRVKPWRHAPDPVAEAQAATAPRPAPRDVNATSPDVLADRDHTLRIAMDAQPKQVNPLITPALWNRRILLGPVFETLIKVAPPEAGDDPATSRYTSGLARSWRIMPSGLEIRLELEPGVTFHDGKPMSSVDVQFTLDLIREPRRGLDHLRQLLVDVQAVELITPTQVRLVLYRPSGWALRALAEIPILPAHLHGGSLAAGGRVVGTGPWRVSSWKPAAVHLTRYPGYWGAAPAISDVEFRYDDDAARVITAAKRGEIDIVPAMIPAHWPEQASAPGLAMNFATVALATPRLRYVAFNTVGGITSDARVRQALALLVDRKSLASDVYDGLAVPVAAPIWPGGPASGTAAPLLPFDPMAAGALFDAAGLRDSDGDGVRDRDGKPVNLNVLVTERPDVPTTGPSRGVPERDRIIDAWRRAGIGVTVREATDAVVPRKLAAGGCDAAFLERNAVADLDLRSWLGTDGSDNLGRFSSPTVDGVLARMGSGWDPGSRVALSGALAQALLAEAPIASIVADVPQALVSHRVQGLAPWGGWFDLTTLSLAKTAAPTPTPDQ